MKKLREERDVKGLLRPQVAEQGTGEAAALKKKKMRKRETKANGRSY